MDYAVNLEKKYFQHVLIIVVDQIARRFPSRCVITCLSLTPSLGPTELLDYCREKNCVQGKLSVSEFFFHSPLRSVEHEFIVKRLLTLMFQDESS